MLYCSYFVADDIVNARTGNFADNEDFKCYIRCIMAQMACVCIFIYFDQNNKILVSANATSQIMIFKVS